MTLSTVHLQRQSPLHTNSIHLPSPLTSHHRTTLTSASTLLIANEMDNMIDLADTFMNGDVEMLVETHNAHHVSTITARNMRKSPLLALPGELRNKIYGYVFEDQEKRIHHFNPVKLSSRRENELKFAILARPKRPHRRLGLLGACRQTYCETTSLLFGGSELRITSLKAAYFIPTLMSQMQRNSLTKLHLDLQWVDSMDLTLYLSKVYKRNIKFAHLLPSVKHVALNFYEPGCERTDMHYMVELKAGLEKWLTDGEDVEVETKFYGWDGEEWDEKRMKWMRDCLRQLAPSMKNR